MDGSHWHKHLIKKLICMQTVHNSNKDDKAMENEYAVIEQQYKDCSNADEKLRLKTVLRTYIVQRYSTRTDEIVSKLSDMELSEEQYNEIDDARKNVDEAIKTFADSKIGQYNATRIGMALRKMNPFKQGTRQLEVNMLDAISNLKDVVEDVVSQVPQEQGIEDKQNEESKKNVNNDINLEDPVAPQEQGIEDKSKKMAASENVSNNINLEDPAVPQEQEIQDKSKKKTASENVSNNINLEDPAVPQEQEIQDKSKKKTASENVSNNINLEDPAVPQEQEIQDKSKKKTASENVNNDINLEDPAVPQEQEIQDKSKKKTASENVNNDINLEDPAVPQEQGIEDKSKKMAASENVDKSRVINAFATSYLAVKSHQKAVESHRNAQAQEKQPLALFKEELSKNANQKIAKLFSTDSLDKDIESKLEDIFKKIDAISKSSGKNDATELAKEIEKDSGVMKLILEVLNAVLRVISLGMYQTDYGKRSNIRSFAEKVAEEANKVQLENVRS